MAESRYKNLWTFLIENNYGDAADIGSDMRCIICTRILINAHNSVCGCRYCLECVKAYLNGEKRFCPGNTDDCKVEELDIDSNIYPDHAINNRISKLIVACRYSCGYLCELRNMEEHERACQKQPVDCPYVNVGCRETRLVTDRINEHLVGENESHARLLMTCIDMLENEIASMKRDTVELRSEMAEMRLAREIDEARVRETNELVDQIKQDVVNLKNENQLTKEENNSLKAEIENYRTEYLGLVAATELRLAEIQAQANLRNENKLVKTEINSLKAEIERCRTEYLGLVAVMERQVAEMRTREQTQAREMELLTEKYSRSEEKLGELEWQTRNDKEKLDRNIDEMREERMSGLTNIERRMRKIEINAKIQNQTEFVWCIDEWAANSQSAGDSTCKDIFSEAFYTHKNGYKMRLSVWPDGWGVDKGTHLSVSFCLMRGPFDNILPWPFKHDVTLSIINQHTGIDHVSDTITFDEFPNSLDWNKPSAEKNAEFITDKLIELTALSSDANLCQGDKLFIRCIVNSPLPCK